MADLGIRVWLCLGAVLLSHQVFAGSTGGAIESKALSGRAAPAGPALFDKLDAQRMGLDFVHHWVPPEQYAFNFENVFFGGGVAIGDYDGDQRPDVYLTQAYGGNRLYRNLGAFQFQDVTEQAGLKDESYWGMSATFADINNDGRLDLYVCGFDTPNRLYINQGSGTFQEEAKGYGLDFSGASVMMAFADYDLDGDLDGYLLTNHLHPPEGTVSGRLEIRKGRVAISQDYLERINAQYDYLYRNNGDGTFSEVSESSGIRGNYFGLSATWWDYNNDHLPDLYVANDYIGPDHLYRNDGDGKFTDVGKTSLPHTPWFSMGADVADINNDGLFDLMGSDMSGTNHFKQKVGMGSMEGNAQFLRNPEFRQYMRNAVYLNTGHERFMEAAYLTGLANTDWTWTIKFADLDSDGLIDLFVTNGTTRDWTDSDLNEQTRILGGGRGNKRATGAARKFWIEQPKKSDENLAFRNRGDLQFEDVSQSWGLNHFGVSFGAALGDLDGDGDLDMVVNNFQEAASIYRNGSVSGHRMKIRLQGATSNSSGIGSTVRIETAGGLQVRYLTLARGYLSNDEPVLHFGLGERKTIDRMTVSWPSGHEQVFENLPADRFYTITEPEGPPPKIKAAQPEITLFSKSTALDLVDHLETPYDDFARQPLLSNKLSQLGPGMAWGDVDGDGDEDGYFSGAAGQAGKLYVHTAQGQFRWAVLEAFAADRAYEDMAPLFFDADADGDLDLYVVSGGVECEPDDALLQDRLYLNNGSGDFTRAPNGTLPELRQSGSCVVAADFDRDGDLDLFVGGRVIPGKYPLTPTSVLLQNDSGRFTATTDQIAPGLSQTGLVTGALWSDANGDGWVDLLVTHEWGPVKLYHNNKGHLEDRTVAANLADRLGWWNGIAAGDIDNDGDIDYVATNFGLNTKYHASPAHPVLTYYGDLDNSGKMHLVEADYEGSTLYPVRGKSCSTNAMPSLGAKFSTYRQFGLAALDEIYTPQCLDDALRFEANTLESGLLLNNGDARFTFQPLPRMAQVAPGFGVTLADVDGDGSLDLYLVQNFYSPQAETGRMDGGVSLLLKGRGDATFDVVWPNRSGLLVSGDAKGLAATDLNGDGWIDFVVGVNDGQVQAFENNGHTKNKMLRVRLQGAKGNPTGVGAQVTVDVADGSRQVRESYAGGSYLSQSSSVLSFGLGQSGQARAITVRWPNGQVSQQEVTGDQTIVSINKPSQELQETAPRGVTAGKGQPGLAGDAQYAAAHHELGRVFAERGRFSEAIRHYQETVRVEPEFSAAHMSLGDALRSTGELDLAIEHYRRALGIQPDFAQAHFGLGYALQGQDDLIGAERHYRRTIAIDPDFAEAHYELGVLLEINGKLQESYQHFAQAARIKPGYGMSHHSVAGVYKSLSQLNEAVSRYRLALVVKPDHVEAHNDLAMILQVQGKLDEAVAHYRQALQVQPDNSLVHNNVGTVLYVQKKLDEAIGHFRRSLEIKPDRPNTHYNLALALLDRKEYAQAIYHNRQVVVLRPGDARPYYYLGIIHQRQGNFDEAVVDFRQALQRRPQWLTAMIDLAWVLATQRTSGPLPAIEAVRLAEQAARATDNKSAPVLDALAAAYAAAGQFERAVRTAQQAIQLEGDPAQREKYQRRLDLYKTGRPCREATR